MCNSLRAWHIYLDLLKQFLYIDSVLIDSLKYILVGL